MAGGPRGTATCIWAMTALVLMTTLLLPLGASQPRSHTDPLDDVSTVVEGQEVDQAPLGLVMPSELADLVGISLENNVQDVQVNFTVSSLERISEVESDPGAQLAYVLSFSTTSGENARIIIAFTPVAIGEHAWVAMGHIIASGDTIAWFEHEVDASTGHLSVRVPKSWLTATLNSTALVNYEPWSQLKYSASANSFFTDAFVKQDGWTFEVVEGGQFFSTNATDVVESSSGGAAEAPSLGLSLIPILAFVASMRRKTG